MKSIYIYLLFLFVLSVSISANAAKIYNWRSELDKTELYLIQGDYKSALKKNTEVINFLLKGEDIFPLRAAYFQAARIHNSLGDFKQYHASCKLGLLALDEFKNEKPEDFLFAMLEGVDAFMEFGDIVKAELLISKSKSSLERARITDPRLVAEVKYKLAQVYFYQGFFQRAHVLLQEVRNLYKARIVTQDAVTDAKTGTVRQKKLTSKETDERKRQYADVLNFQARIYIANGAYTEADSLLKYTKSWIRSQLRSKDFKMIQSLYLEGLLQENLNNKKEAYKAYTSALDLYARSKGLHYTHYSVETGKLFQKAILMARAVGKNKEGSKDENSYESKIKRFYGKKNFYYGQVAILEAEQDLLGEDFEDAEEGLNKLLEDEKILPAGHPERIRCYEMLYSIHIHADRYDKAESDLQEILKIEKEMTGEHSPVYHMALLDIANFRVFYANDFRDAEYVYKESLEKILAREIDHRCGKYIDYIYAQTRLYQITDRFEYAERIMSRASEEIRMRFGPLHLHYAVVMEKLADLDIDLGHYVNARKRLGTAIEIYKNQQDNTINFNSDYAQTMCTFGKLLIIEGNYAEAEKHLKKAYKLLKDSDEDENLKISNVAEELASLNMYTGKYQETETSLKEDIEIKEKRFGTSSRNLINPYNQLANLYLIIGDYTEAEKSVKKATAIILPVFGDSSVIYTESLKLMENIYSSMGDYEKAEESIRKVVNIQSSKYGRNHMLLANSLSEMAMIKFLNHGEKSEIEQLFVQALNIIKNNLGEKHPQYAEVLKNLALFYLETNKISDAEKNIQKAKDIWIAKLGEENIHTAELLMIEGNILSVKGQYEAAKEKYTDAKNTYLSIFDVSHPNYVKAVSHIGEMNYILGDYKNAVKNLDETTTSYLTFIKKYFPALSEREKNKFWALIKNDFEFYNSMAVKLKKTNPQLISNIYNFALNTKSLLLSSSIKVKERIMNSKDAILIKKYEDWVAKKEFLVTVISMSNEQRRTNMIDIKLLEKEIENLEKDLSSSSELFIPDTEKDISYTWDKVKDGLKDNEIAIEIVRFRNFTKSFTDTIYYAALVITPKTKNHPELVLLENGKELETKFIKYYRNSIKLKTDDEFSYDNYWKPLRRYVRDNTVVYLSSDGVYGQINVETLKSSSGSYVIDKNDIILVSNTKDLIKKSKPVKSKKEQQVAAPLTVALFGNPTYYQQASDTSILSDSLRPANNNVRGKISSLPGAEKEVNELYNLLLSSNWAPKLYLNNEAEEDSVKNLKNPKVFHIATHGFFLEDDKDNDVAVLNEQTTRNPLLRSGLLLKNGGALLEHDNVYDFNTEDGVLTAYEAMNLNLDKTDLVVLSACETGLGEVQLGEGVYGLQRAFQVAGAKSVIMSLFKVSDNVTQELMLNFYQKWIATGDKRKSFTDAKKEIKAKYPEPIYWGSFIMIGTN
jgi:CHAT domain-containing protein